MAAVHLLKITDAPRLRVVLIDPAPAGRGLAYNTADPKHLLNVPAGGMSAFENEPDDFVRYLKARDDAAFGGEFVPRFVYGDYLVSLLNAAILQKPNNVEFEFLRIRAIDIRESGSQCEVVCADGATILADKIILALGNAAPTRLPLRNQDFFESSSRYINNPWCADLLDRIDWKKPLLLLGTGLTAVDVAVKLASHRYRPTMHAVSRRGLHPIAHRGLAEKLPALELPPLPREAKSAAKILKFVRKAGAEAIDAGRDWRDIVAALRPHLPYLWQQLSIADRGRFLRHGSAHWDVHRHRLAPPVAAFLQDLISSRRLRIAAARVSTLVNSGDGVDVRLRPRGKQKYKKLAVGTVINCTGPNADLHKDRNPFTQALLQRGILKPDALKLGIEIDDDYRVGAADSALSASVFYVGPWLKAKYWEATAVPELRVHVRNVVENVIASLRGDNSLEIVSTKR
jgi:uncharacterized NAD(P)/FAD-binding protein YdhS